MSDKHVCYPLWLQNSSGSPLNILAVDERAEPSLKMDMHVKIDCRWMKPFNRSVTHLSVVTHIPSTEKRPYPRNTRDPAQKLSLLRPYVNLIEELVVMDGDEVSKFWLRSAMWFAKASKREG